MIVETKGLEFSFLIFADLTKAGTANARVFPEPVGAIPTKSLPYNNIFIDLDWIYVGLGNYFRYLPITVGNSKSEKAEIESVS